MNIRLTIQCEETLYEPPIEEGVQIEWERSGTPGKLTFTTIKVEGLKFNEGDQVCFYYDDKLVFVGYVFSKSRDKEHRIKVTCYDQIRYLKNKYTYVFESKTATQIVDALCKDFNLVTGDMDNTSYVIPAIAEENKAALDIILSVLEETLLNTGNMFILQDESGKIRIRNVANLVSTTLICDDTAENFDYKSSIDDETYNNVVLYYKGDDGEGKIFTASSPTTIKRWGLLRHFEEIKTPTIGQNKAISLLKLYNKRTRELKVSGAFGDISIRGGTLIPIKLYLGDIQTNNFMLVEKVTHKFDKDRHTMDLTLEGGWGDETNDIVTDVISFSSPTVSQGTGSGGYGGGAATSNTGSTRRIQINVLKPAANGTIRVKYTLNGEQQVITGKTSSFSISADINSIVVITTTNSTNCKWHVEATTGEGWNISSNNAAFVYSTSATHSLLVKSNSSISLNWYEASGQGGGGQTSGTGGGRGGSSQTNNTGGGGQTSGTGSGRSGHQQLCFYFYNSDYKKYLNNYSIQYYRNGVLTIAGGSSLVANITADEGSSVKISLNLKPGTKVSKTASTGSWSGSGSYWQTSMNGYRALTLKLYK